MATSGLFLFCNLYVLSNWVNKKNVSLTKMISDSSHLSRAVVQLCVVQEFHEGDHLSNDVVDALLRPPPSRPFIPLTADSSPRHKLHRALAGMPQSRNLSHPLPCTNFTLSGIFRPQSKGVCLTYIKVNERVINTIIP